MSGADAPESIAGVPRRPSRATIVAIVLIALGLGVFAFVAYRFTRSERTGSRKLVVAFGRGCVIRPNRTVVCWGDKGAVPMLVPDLREVARVSIGDMQSCALRLDGRVVCWGREARPVQVQNLDDAVAIAAGESHTCAVRAGGSVVCWGSNFYGTLGDGTKTDRASPTPVLGLDDAVDVQSGARHTCARRKGGTLMCWGESLPFVGDATTADHLAPTQVLGVSDITSMAIGLFTMCAVRSDRSVLCWGSKYAGTWPGDGSTKPSAEPVNVPDLRNVEQVVLGTSHACALRADGRVVCWGENEMGQVGDGTTEDRPKPVQVMNLDHVVEIAAGTSSTCARVANGTVWCWGSNERGAIGLTSADACKRRGHTFHGDNAPKPCSLAPRQLQMP